jgi:tRNA uridine 5-carboxymethylaminomethyl modification enzyme
MFTSRAEYRLLLRNDNADLRLSKIGYEIGLVAYDQCKLVEKKQKAIDDAKELLAGTKLKYQGKGTTAKLLLTRPDITIDDVKILTGITIDESIKNSVQTEIKYAGYLSRQMADTKKLQSSRNWKLPADMEFNSISGLRNEAKLRLSEVQPADMAQAMQIQGITPADLSVLMVAAHKHKQLA